jgi:uncharacterized protein
LKTEDFTFLSGEHRLAATRLHPPGGRGTAIMALHGLGPTATRHGIRYVLDYLASHGHGAMCFEFSGNGDSTGLLAESSLQRRYSEALAAASHLAAYEQPTLIGTSLGAHLAAWLVPKLRPSGLVLFCPATYPAHAADLKFDSQFVRPGRYADSPAYAGIREFDGNLLIVAAKNDQVVPADVIDGYFAGARNARSKEIIWLDDCDHFIHRWLPHNEARQNGVLEAILRVASVPSNSLRQGIRHAT